MPPRFGALDKQGKPAEAVAALDALFKSKPGWESSLGFFRFTLLLKADEPQAYRYARRLIDTHLRDDANMLRAVRARVESLEKQSGGQ